MSPTRFDWVLIDGYSLLHRDPELAPMIGQNLDLARQLLLRKADRIAGPWAERVTVVFDGKQSKQTLCAEHIDVEVLFAPAKYTADTVIERLVMAALDPGRVLVVTSDRAERETVMAAGADSMSCGHFLNQDQPVRTAPGYSSKSKGKPFTLGDCFL